MIYLSSIHPISIYPSCAPIAGVLAERERLMPAELTLRPRWLGAGPWRKLSGSSGAPKTLEVIRTTYTTYALRLLKWLKCDVTRFVTCGGCGRPKSCTDHALEHFRLIWSLNLWPEKRYRSCPSLTPQKMVMERRLCHRVMPRNGWFQILNILHWISRCILYIYN